MKSFIYSLPIPMSLVLATTHPVVNSDQLIGVGVLVLFFFVFSALKLRLGWRTLPSVVVAVAFYLVAAAFVRLLPPAHFVATLVVVVLLWMLVATHALVRGLPARRPEGDHISRTGREQVVRFGILTVATVVMAFLARYLGGLAVTFPYSGTLVSFDLGRGALDFARNFALNSISLVVFFAAYAAVQGQMDTLLSLAVAWVAFFIASGAVLLVRRYVPVAAEAGLRWERPRETPSTTD